MKKADVKHFKLEVEALAKTKHTTKIDARKDKELGT